VTICLCEHTHTRNEIDETQDECKCVGVYISMDGWKIKREDDARDPKFFLGRLDSRLKMGKKRESFSSAGTRLILNGTRDRKVREIEIDKGD